MHVNYTQEIPIAKNSHIYQLDEREKVMVSVPNIGVPINRYRFFGELINDTNKGNVSLKILNDILPKLDSNIYWLLSWREGKPNAVRSKLTMSKRMKEGWEVWKQRQLNIAIKPINKLRVFPEGYTWQEGGCAFLIKEDHITVPFPEGCIPTIEYLALSGFLCPGIEFMDFLESENMSCCYLQRDELGGFDIILITQKNIQIRDDGETLLSYELLP